MYIMLLKVYCSSFSAVAAAELNRPMIDLLRNKDEFLDLDEQYLILSAINKREREKCKVDQWKRKGIMESTV